MEQWSKWSKWRSKWSFQWSSLTNPTKWLDDDYWFCSVWTAITLRCLFNSRTQERSCDWTGDVDNTSRGRAWNENASLGRPLAFRELQTERTFSAILWFSHLFCCISPPRRLSFGAQQHLAFSSWGHGKSFVWTIGWRSRICSDCAAVRFDFLQFVHCKMTLLSFRDNLSLLFVWNCTIYIIWSDASVWEANICLIKMKLHELLNT